MDYEHDAILHACTRRYQDPYPGAWAYLSVFLHAMCNPYVEPDDFSPHIPLENTQETKK